MACVSHFATRVEKVSFHILYIKVSIPYLVVGWDIFQCRLLEVNRIYLHTCYNTLYVGTCFDVITHRHHVTLQTVSLYGVMT
jgi:hypothetical protein